MQLKGKDLFLRRFGLYHKLVSLVIVTGLHTYNCGQYRFLCKTIYFCNLNHQFSTIKFSEWVVYISFQIRLAKKSSEKSCSDQEDLSVDS